MAKLSPYETGELTDSIFFTLLVLTEPIHGYLIMQKVAEITENNIIIGNISSNCIANIYYILRKSGGNSKARKFIANIVKYITVITIDHQNILDALKSKFSDFEDALQYFSAVENQCEYIITRNIEDYKNAEIKVLLPEEFIGMF